MEGVGVPFCNTYLVSLRPLSTPHRYLAETLLHFIKHSINFFLLSFFFHSEQILLCTLLFAEIAHTDTNQSHRRQGLGETLGEKGLHGLPELGGDIRNSRKAL